MSINLIRKLARDFKWQFLYSKSKDMPNITLFGNNSDFTRLQVDFLQWLEVYNVVENDIVCKKPYISKDVIEDDLRLDAYLLLRKQLDKEENQKSSSKKPGKEKTPHPSIPSVVFKRG